MCGRMTSILICHFMGWDPGRFAVLCTLNSTFTSTLHVRPRESSSRNDPLITPVCWRLICNRPTASISRQFASHFALVEPASRKKKREARANSQGVVR